MTSNSASKAQDLSFNRAFLAARLQCSAGAPTHYSILAASHCDFVHPGRLHFLRVIPCRSSSSSSDCKNGFADLLARHTPVASWREVFLSTSKEGCGWSERSIRPSTPARNDMILLVFRFRLVCISFVQGVVDNWIDYYFVTVVQMCAFLRENVQDLGGPSYEHRVSDFLSWEVHAWRIYAWVSVWNYLVPISTE